MIARGARRLRRRARRHPGRPRAGPSASSATASTRWPAGWPGSASAGAIASASSPRTTPAYLELYGACARQGIVAYPDQLAAHRRRGRARGGAGGAEDVRGRRVHPAGRRRLAPDPDRRSRTGTSSARRRRPASRRSPRSTGIGAPPPPADVASDDAFAVISTAAVDVVPRGAVAHPRQRAWPPTSRPSPASATRRPIAICSRCRCSTSPRSAPRWRTCTPAAPAWWCRATTPRRRCG